MDLKKVLKTNSRYLTILNSNHIKTPKDFFEFFPRTYEDRTNIKTLNEISTDGSPQHIKGQITSKSIIRTPKGKSLIEMHFKDENNNIGKINMLNARYTYNKVIKDQWYIIIGKAKFERGQILFWHPELVLSQKSDSNNEIFKFGRLYPIYTELQGISHNWFAKKAWENLYLIPTLFKEYFPDEFLKRFNLLKIDLTIKNLHFPENNKILGRAKYRIFFERLIKIQLISQYNKQKYVEQMDLTDKSLANRDTIKNSIKDLPFKLTKAQKKCIKQIVEDFHSGKTMLRLLQGDVGSGKTIVAAIVADYLIQNKNCQIAFLAPTEVLAQQHNISLGKYFLPKGIRIELLTGSTTAKQKQKIKAGLKQGKINVIIGTHAIIQEDVKFQNIKLAIIDEQHKFGVMQRAFFKKFGSPHILQMTATPIPRSMTLAFFGEFDVSIIDEMPEGRKKIFTKIINLGEFKKLKQWMITKISQNQKIYIITPLIEESENLDEVQSAIQEYEEITKFLPKLKDNIGLLHGKMKPKDKDKTMKEFKNGKYKILVSTTVIEVGIDVPEATIMVIKNAERFGLSQLHQLRGRVGRSELQSYCFLLSKSKSGDTYKRLKAMEKYTDGFKLAELDLIMRGGGEILGIRQSGEADIPFEILRNVQFLKKVQDASIWLLDKYPNLEGLKLLKEELFSKEKNILI